LLYGCGGRVAGAALMILGRAVWRQRAQSKPTE
jgi:hypothetical protein